MSFKEWNEVEDIDQFLSEPGDAIIFKHSTRCGISTVAHEEMEKFLGEGIAIDVFKILVVEQRPLSNHIAETLEVRHQSPQAILVRDGKPVWETTHYSITSTAVKEALSTQGIGS